VIGGFALVAAGTAKYEVALIWPDLTAVQQLIVAIEIGIVTAYVFQRSFDGAKVLLGLILGVGISVLLETVMKTEFWPLNASLVWYSFFAVAGVISLTITERYTLSFVQPVIGGFLCASALGFFIKTWVDHMVHSGTPPPSMPSWVEPRGDCWLDFATELIGGEKTAGVIKDFQAGENRPISFDKGLGYLAWFIFFAIGVKRQWKMAKKNTENQLVSLTDSFLGRQKVTPKDAIWGA